MPPTPTGNTPKSDQAPVVRNNPPRPVTASISGAQGGSGVQRTHLRNRKQWLRDRDRGGMNWMARKMASKEYCGPTSVRRG